MVPEREPVVEAKSIAVKRESARSAEVAKSACVAETGGPHTAHMADAAHAHAAMAETGAAAHSTTHSTTHAAMAAGTTAAARHRG